MKPTDLATELADLAQARADLVAAAEAVDPAEWNAPAGDGKWSPAQVVEHLRLAFVTLSAELAGEAGFRVRTRWWQRGLFRLRLLRRILDTGRFPEGVPATREIRPGPGPFDRRALLAALVDDGERFAAAARAAPAGASVTHPFLGALRLLEGVRFTTQHLRHHHAQIVPVATAGGVQSL